MRLGHLLLTVLAAVHGPRLAGAEPPAPAPAPAPAQAPGQAPAPAPAPAPDARRLVALLVGDTHDPEIGESVAVDVRALEQALVQAAPVSRLALHRLVGEGVRPERLLAAVRDLPVGPEDALLCYYAGHGAWADTGPYLRLGGGAVLPRADLMAALRARGARLTVLLSDCCSTYVGQTMLWAPPSVDPAVLRDLFYRPRGVVDVTAAQRGQVAVGDTNLGGVFTYALTTLLTQTPREALDSDKDGRVAWSEALTALTAGSKAAFGLMYPRGLSVKGQRLTGQSPHVFGDLAPPAPPVPPPPRRLGVRVEPAPGGLRIAAVEPGTPAAWMDVRPGEVLVEVRVAGRGPEADTLPTPTAAHLGRALEAAGPGGLAVLVLVDPQAKDAQGAPLTREVPVRLGP